VKHSKSLLFTIVIFLFNTFIVTQATRLSKSQNQNISHASPISNNYLPRKDWHIGLPMNENEETPLYVACRNNQIEVLKLLFNESKINIEKPNINGETPFWIACYEGNTLIVKFLLNNKANPEATNKLEETPLYVTCHEGYAEIVKLLIKSNKVNLEATNKKGRGAIHVACYKGHIAIVRLLLNSKKVKINTVTKDKRTALDIVHDQMKDCKKLIEWEKYNAIWDMLTKRDGKFNKNNSFHVLSPKKPPEPEAKKRLQQNKKHIASQPTPPLSTEETKENE